MTFTLAGLHILEWKQSSWANSEPIELRPHPVWERFPWRKGHCHVWLWASPIRHSLQPPRAPKQSEDYTVWIPVIVLLISYLSLAFCSCKTKKHLFSITFKPSASPTLSNPTSNPFLYGSKMSSCWWKDNFALQSWLAQLRVCLKMWASTQEPKSPGELH